jgi:NAD(P)-dependent dehydrogenase (short-subunit alcohol dehydrogenase family)
MTFATNHLGHFALARGRHDALAAVGDARIVSVSSVGHRRSPVIFDDLNFSSRPYDVGLAYGQQPATVVWSSTIPGTGSHWMGCSALRELIVPGLVQGGGPLYRLPRGPDGAAAGEPRGASALRGAILM